MQGDLTVLVVKRRSIFSLLCELFEQPLVTEVRRVARQELRAVQPSAAYASVLVALIHPPLPPSPPRPEPRTLQR